MESREAAERDALRRRLYAQGATAEDVARYRALLDADAAAPPPPRRSAHRPAADAPAERAEAAPRPLRPSAPVLVGAGLVLAVVVGAAVATVRLSATPTPTPTATAQVAVRPTRTVLPIDATTRTGFLRALEAGHDAGIGVHLYEHPDARPASVRTVSRAAADEYHGRGTTIVSLQPTDLAQHGGRVTVVVVLDRPARFAWRLTRSSADGYREPEQPIGVQRGSLAAGEAATGTVAYDDRAPDRITILVPDGVRWGALVVFTD